jgi:phosphatidylglycerophosphate synthase
VRLADQALEQRLHDSRARLRVRVYEIRLRSDKPTESLGKQKSFWQIITIIFFLALLSIAELRYANETFTWWLRAWGEAGPVLVWVSVALTIYSGPGFTWRNRELIAPDQ